MPDVRPFRGFRYDLGRTGSLSDLLAPPYDVIDAAGRADLLARSEFNAVRVELPDEASGMVDKYTAAARLFNGWLASDAVRQDTGRCFYVLEQEFTVDDRTHTRRGFLAGVRVEPAESGLIFPHEETLSAPREDRLKLLRATGFHLSPAFGLYPDADGAVDARLARSIAASPPTTAVDADGVTHRLWAVTDQGATSEVVGLMGPKPVTIADGHHRYATARRYCEELAPLDEDHPANFVLMHLVGTSDPGLIVRPTHRVFAGLPPVPAAQLRELLSPAFEVIAEFGTDALACWEHVQMEDDQAVLGIVSRADNQCFAVRLADPAAVPAGGHSAEWRGLAVSALHEAAVPRIARGAEVTTRYHHDLAGVLADLAAGAGEVAALVPAVDVMHVEVIAGGRELMPAKSTYFYPKVPAGLVFHSAKRD